jgi:hypothetical protein
MRIRPGFVLSGRIRPVSKDGLGGKSCADRNARAAFAAMVEQHMVRIDCSKRGSSQLSNGWAASAPLLTPKKGEACQTARYQQNQILIGTTPYPAGLPPMADNPPVAVVMIVEDEPLVRAIMVEFLSRQGVEVVEAELRRFWFAAQTSN